MDFAELSTNVEQYSDHMTLTSHFNRHLTHCQHHIHHSLMEVPSSLQLLYSPIKP